MSDDLNKIQAKLGEMALAESSPDALRVIDTLSKEVDRMRNELLYERLETPDAPSDQELHGFKLRFYENLKRERATDLAISYDRSELKQYKPATRLAIAQVLVTIAKEQSAKIPSYWQQLLDSRGHD